MHDLGHGPFSHVFENEFMRLAQYVCPHHALMSSPSIEFSHEKMSVDMMEYLVEDNSVDMERADLNLVHEIVVGAKG